MGSFVQGVKSILFDRMIGLWIGLFRSDFIQPGATQRAVFKLGAKKLFVFCLLVRDKQMFTVMTGVHLKGLKRLPRT